jgi:hypothetical protein
MESLYEKTKYKNIYKFTYWGNGGYDEDDNITNQIHINNIINNRNNFIENYNVQNIIIKKPQYLNKYLSELRNNSYLYDHLEVYKIHNNQFLIVNSPYCAIDGEQQLLNNGWIKIYKLYSDVTSTFIKIIDKNSIKQFVIQNVYN